MSSAVARNSVELRGNLASDFDYKSATQSILSRLAATTHESDRMRRLSDDAANALKESGLSRLITPRKFGGYEMSPSSLIWTCAEIGNVCSAASWVLMVCVAHDYIIGRFPEECQREVYEGDADNLVAGSLAPGGALEPVEGGWRLTGRWMFGSGSDHSPWFIVGARNGQPGANDPIMHHVMVPRADVELDDTWHTLGMRGRAPRTCCNERLHPGLIARCRHTRHSLGLARTQSPRCTGCRFTRVCRRCCPSAVLGMAEGGLKAFVDMHRRRGRIPTVSSRRRTR